MAILINNSSGVVSSHIINTANTGIVTHNSSTTTPCNTYGSIPYYSNGMIYNSHTVEQTVEQTIEFTEFLFKLLDIDMDFKKFVTMDEGEKATFVRQHVIGNIIK